MTKPLCIFHSPCADGFMAAVIVRRNFGEGLVDFHPGVYGEAPPDVKDRDVIMVDFSYKRPVLLEMAAQARSILILDHHASAEKDLVDLPDNVVCVFDMDRSGAMITWEYFFDSPPPVLVQHVQDRDLWRFHLPHTKEIQSALFSFEYDFDVWEALLSDPEAVTRLTEEGAAITRKHMKDVRELIEQACYRTVLAGHDIPVVNAPYFHSSDIGHILAEGEAFAACYWLSGDGVKFSLRSAEDGVDVSEVASQFGGGGHKHAAGFTMSHEQFKTLPTNKRY